MKTIINEVENEIIINKSRFIAVLIPINDKSKVYTKLDEIKSKYKDATHYCYGYIINSLEKCFDDGEPSGTAGMPILNVLKNNNLTNILCVVVRYFGGIKLGAGGLVRAYSSAATQAILKCDFGFLEKGYKITIEFDYDNIKNIDYILNNIHVIKQFDEKVIYTFSISEDDINILDNVLKYSKIVDKSNITIIKGD